MHQQEGALQPIGVRERRALRVAARVLLWRPHVALGVDRVVEPPIGDRRDGDPRLEHVVPFEQAERRHVAAVAPAPDADPLAVDVG